MSNAEALDAAGVAADPFLSGAHAAASASPERLPFLKAIGWGSGALGQAIAVYAFSVLLLRYLTDSVGMSAAIAGILIGASKLVDAVVDPFIGAASDRTTGRFGRRTPWMFAGSILLGAAIMVLFNVPVVIGDLGKTVYLALALVLYSVGFACFSIPWVAMPAEMTRDYHGRSIMMSCRVFASAAGQAVGAYGASMILASRIRTTGEYTRLGIIMGLVSAATMLVTVWMLRNTAGTTRDTAKRPPAMNQLKTVLGNRPFLIVLGMKFCGFFAVTMQASSMAFFTTYVLHLSDTWLASFYFALTIGMIVGQPIWLRASRRFDKKRTLAIALIMQTILYLTLSLNLYEGAAWLVGHGALLGFSGGGIYLLTQSMLPDTLEYDYQRTGMRREGTLSGIGATIEKTSSALGIASLGILLSATGYVAASAGPGTQQPAEALLAVRAGACFAPALLVFVALLMLSAYDLSEARLRRGREAREATG